MNEAAIGVCSLLEGKEQVRILGAHSITRESFRVSRVRFSVLGDHATKQVGFLRC
jgi:hypothetical protein